MKKVTKKFRNLSRRKKIVVVTCSLLVLLLVISVPTAIVLSTDKKEVETSSKKTIKSKSKTKKDKSNKEKEVEKKDDGEKEDSKSKEDDSKKTNDKKETTQETSKQSTNSTGSSGSGNNGGNASSKPAQQPQQSAPVSQPTPAPKPQTAWEKLGISEYDYYNTPRNPGDEVAIKGADVSACQSEIRRLQTAYITQGLSGGGSYTVYSKGNVYLGCGIRIYLNGNTYSYSQIKSMGFN